MFFPSQPWTQMTTVVLAESLERTLTLYLLLKYLYWYSYIMQVQHIKAQHPFSLFHFWMRQTANGMFCFQLMM